MRLCERLFQDSHLASRRLEESISPQEHARLVEAFDPYWQPLIRVWPFIGLRISEVFGLRWENVDLKGGKLHVRQQAPKRATEVKAPLKTKAANRTIPLTAGTVTILRQWKLACPHSSHDLVFPAKNGGFQNVNNFRNRYWSDAREAAKLPDITPHVMRHTFVSTLFRAGADIKYVQTVAGHENAKTTMDTYGHWFAEARPDVLAKAEAVYRNIGVTGEDDAQESGS